MLLNKTTTTVVYTAEVSFLMTTCVSTKTICIDFNELSYYETIYKHP